MAIWRLLPKGFSPWSQLVLYKGNSLLRSTRQLVFCDIDSPRSVLEVQRGCWLQLGALVIGNGAVCFIQPLGVQECGFILGLVWSQSQMQSVFH